MRNDLTGGIRGPLENETLSLSTMNCSYRSEFFTALPKSLVQEGRLVLMHLCQDRNIQKKESNEGAKDFMGKPEAASTENRTYIL